MSSSHEGLSASSNSVYDGVSSSSSSSGSSEPLPSLSSLPHPLLLQTWQHLDQPTRTGLLIPRVNRQWHQLSPATLTSLSLTFTSAASPRYFSRWLENHPQASLQHLSLDFRYLEVSQELSSRLVQVICTSLATSQLKSLHLTELPLNFAHTSCLPSLTSLTSLTSLRLSSCFSDPSSSKWDLQPLLKLTQRRVLEVSSDKAAPQLQALKQLLPNLGKALQQLEVLDVNLQNLSLEDIQCLSSITSLKQVKRRIIFTEEVLPRVQELSVLPPTSVDILSLGAGMPHLVSMCVQHAGRQLEDIRLISFEESPFQALPLLRPLSSLSTLRSLALFQFDLRGQALDSFATLTGLTSLRIAPPYTAGDLCKVLTALSNLRKPELVIVDEELPNQMATAAAGKGPPFLPHLSHLVLQGSTDSPPGSGCVEFSHAVLLLQSFSPQLRTLVISGLDGVHSKLDCLQSCSLLESLSLMQYPKAETAEALVALSNLKALELPGDFGATETGYRVPIEALAFTCLTHLKALTMRVTMESGIADLKTSFVHMKTKESSPLPQRLRRACMGLMSRKLQPCISQHLYLLGEQLGLTSRVKQCQDLQQWLMEATAAAAAVLDCTDIGGEDAAYRGDAPTRGAGGAGSSSSNSAPAPASATARAGSSTGFTVAKGAASCRKAANKVAASSPMDQPPRQQQEAMRLEALAALLEQHEQGLSNVMVELYEAWLKLPRTGSASDDHQCETQKLKWQDCMRQVTVCSKWMM